jgi:hypothetical protein
MIVTRVRLSTFAVVSVAALVGAGCGGGGESDREQVESAVKDYASALRGEDFDAACEALTEDSRQQVEQAGAQAGGDCPAILKQVSEMGSLGDIPDPDEVEFDSVEIDGDTATVEIAGGDAPAQLRKEDDEWKFDFGQAAGGAQGGAAPEGGAAPPEGGAAPPEGE